MTLIPNAGDDFGGATDTYQAPSFFDIPETEDQQKDDVAAQLAEMRANQARLEAELKAANDRKIPQNFEQQYQPPQTQQQIPHQTPQDISKQLTDAFYTDPGKTLQNMLLAAQQNAEQTAAKKYIPVAAMAVRNQIQYYKQGAGMDPDVAKEFDALVNNIPDAQLAEAQSGQIQNYLEVLKNQAAGQALSKGWVPKAQNNNIPSYSGSSGGSVPLRPNQKRMQLNAAQREALAEIDNNPYYKTWTQAQKLEALKDFE